ncbi:MAG: hypothetical protein D6695_05250, partial [Planctomycetota bacterium]
PTWNETKICIGIWAFGLLVYTICVRITVPVLTGRLVHDRPFRDSVQALSTRPVGHVMEDH